MSKPTLKVNVDFTKNFQEVVDQFKGEEVLVGIPEEKGARKTEDQTGITNAGLLFINEFGSPVQNIPARPVMAIGIKGAQEEIAEQFKKAAQVAFEVGMSAVDKYYERAGFIAANSVKRAINNQTDIDGPAESTLRARESRGFKGTKSLVVTGQMRNAITFVLVKGGKK